MRTEFILRRIHSFTGVIPLFLFLAYHIPHTAMPFLTFNFVEHPLPVIIALGIVPLAIHGLLGVYILIKNKKAGADRSSGKTAQPGLLHKLQKISAIIILLFVCSHVFLFQKLRYAEGYPIYIISIIVYFLGILALSFHIGYGTYTFCLTWGLGGSPRAQRIIRTASAVLGTALGIVLITLFVLVFISIKGMLSL